MKCSDFITKICHHNQFFSFIHFHGCCQDILPMHCYSSTIFVLYSMFLDPKNIQKEVFDWLK